MDQTIDLIDKLKAKTTLSKEEWITLINGRTCKASEYLFALAREIQRDYYGREVYIRGLIEFTNYCRNNCYYCGIRKDNTKIHRYRLTKEQILSCCENGYQLGFRTFVLQGGEDSYFTDERLRDLIMEIKKKYPDCALTLSIGERKKAAYQDFFDAGADRFLLRHETSNPTHYRYLHPENLSCEHRKSCLWNLKEIGYQTGSGFMVGSPGQTAEDLAEDLLFLKKLNPQMVGIGPFIPHCDTPFAKEDAGTMEMTLYLIGLLRLMLPSVLLPATTALGTIHPNGREKGILAGANVVMPNLSPQEIRKDYSLYDNKLCTDEEAAEYLDSLQKRMNSIGYRIVTNRGDYKPVTAKTKH